MMGSFDVRVVGISDRAATILWSFVGRDDLCGFEDILGPLNCDRSCGIEQCLELYLEVAR